MRQLQTEGKTTPSERPVSRRLLLGLLAGGGIAGGLYVFGDGAKSNPIRPEAALARLRNKSLILIDVRQPDEWALTGVATGAVLLDLRDAAFVETLDRLTAGNRAAPVALICARGVRSRKLAAKLTAAGFSGVLDVSEGMLGSTAGPGWIARGLPVSPYRPGEAE